MRYLNTCDGNMQEGSLRADVNVSVKKKDSKKLGTRCEIKNVNSIKFMQLAIDYEANRQVDLIEEDKLSEILKAFQMKFPNLPIYPISSLRGEGLENLKEELFKQI